MIDFMKDVLKNDKTGEPSSSRVNSTVLIVLSAVGFLFTLFIIGHSYFVSGVIPSSDSILIYLIGGGTGSAVTGAVVYGVGKYADRDLPTQPSEEIAMQNIVTNQVEDSLNNNENGH